MESIHIVTTSSDSFAIHSAVMIHSLLENLASENRSKHIYPTQLHVPTESVKIKSSCK